MKFKQIIEKAVNGEKLSNDEISSLKSIDPDNMLTEITSLKNQICELENAPLSDNEKLQKTIDALTAERDQLNRDFSRLSRQCRIAEIARDSGCNEPEYLDYLTQRANVDLADETAVRNFVSGLRETHPACFTSQLKSGGGCGIVSTADPAENISSPPVSRIDFLVQSLCNAPFKE